MFFLMNRSNIERLQDYIRLYKTIDYIYILVSGKERQAMATPRDDHIFCDAAAPPYISMTF